VSFHRHNQETEGSPVGSEREWKRHAGKNAVVQCLFSSAGASTKPQSFLLPCKAKISATPERLFIEVCDAGYSDQEP
jgi:hypothetical protein